MAVNLCNNSFFPTVENYRKQIEDQHDSAQIYSKYLKQSTNDNMIKQMLKNNNLMYRPEIVELVKHQQRSTNFLYSTPLTIQKFDLVLMYKKLIQYQRKCETSMVDIQINPESQLFLYYKTFITNLQISFSKKQSKQNKICNLINIINPQLINWQPFQTTSLSELKIAKIKYTYNEVKSKQALQIKSSLKQSFNNYHYFQSTMILKHQPLQKMHQKYPYLGQLKWEKTLIQECFKNQYCIYLAKFFIPLHQQKTLIKNIQVKQSTCILSQYMKRGTLQKWLTENGFLSSIFTKVNIILYILYGVTFLHSKKVLHMDLKPQNILMDKNLIPKLTDFGSAYNKQVYEKMRKEKHHYYLSFSVPYTAPQIFMKSHRPQINAKCDIFSLGFMMFEILFNQSILGESNERLQQIFKKIGRRLDSFMDYKQKNGQHNSLDIGQQLLLKRIFLCPQNLDEEKSSLYMLYLNLIMRCLSCSQQKRPNLGMLIIGIKQIYQMFVEYYVW